MGVPSVFAYIVQVNAEIAPETDVQVFPPTDTLISAEVNPMVLGSLSAKLRVVPE